MSIGRVFHNEAAAVSIKRLPYFTVLFLLRVNRLSFIDRSCLPTCILKLESKSANITAIQDSLDNVGSLLPHYSDFNLI